MERATGRRFSVSHLLQMRALYPEGLELEYVNPPGTAAAAVLPPAAAASSSLASLPPMLLAIRVKDPPAGSGSSAREEFARRLRGAAEAAARRAAREAEGRCTSPAASGCRKSGGGTRARTEEEEGEEEDEGQEVEASARGAPAARAASPDPALLVLPEAPLPPLPAGRVAATPLYAPSASMAAAGNEGEEEQEGEKPSTKKKAAAGAAAAPSAFPRPPLAPSSSSIASRARQRLTFGDAGGAAAVGAAAAALSDAEVLRASLPPELAEEAIEASRKDGGGGGPAGLADLPLSAVRAAHAAQARRDAVSDPRRAEARARSALLALLPRAFDCARAALGGGGPSSAPGLGSLRIPGGRPPTPTPCVKPLSLVHDALSRAVLGSGSSFPAIANSTGDSSTIVLDAPTLLRELAAAAPEVFSVEPPRLGREAEGHVLRVNRAADAGAARARLAAAAAADRASNAA